jgi:hypothetical protein
MNTVIRTIRPDEAEDAEAALGRSLDQVFPRRTCRSCTPWIRCRVGVDGA